MQSFTKSIFDLFNARRRYLIPLFQRQYVWGREKQWEPLWEDIRAKALDHLNGREVDPHFLGAIVLSQVPTFDDQLLAHDVIDGQQRLTTFQLVLAAFRDLALAQGDTARADDVRYYTLNTGLMDGPHEAYKVWPTNADQEQFLHVISAGTRAKLEETYPPVYERKRLKPRPQMVEAYLYFYGALEEFLAEPGEWDALTRIRGLYQAMHRSLQLVSIELEGKDDPQVIFETLNARGEPLLSSDLLRNFIFMRAYRENLVAKDLYEAYWLEFDTKPAESGEPDSRFWKVPERQGRLLRPRLDLFIQHFLALKTERDVNAGKLYQSYRQWILGEKPYGGIEAELQDLTRFAKIFEKFFVPETSTRMGTFVSRLRLLDTSTVYPLLLYVESESRISDADRAGIAEDLESFLIRRWVCGLTTKHYNHLFLQLLRGLSELETVTRDAFRQILLAQTGDATCWPDDARFREAWLSVPVYRTMKSPKRVEMILRAIEDFETSSKRENIVILGDLTVEHVMPQSWEANWPLIDDGGDRSKAIFDRGELLHTFGNLTLLTQALNSSVGNASYADRRPAITAQSALKLNAYFQNKDTWDEVAIRERGRALFETAIKVWPYPTTQASQVVPHQNIQTPVTPV